MLSSSSQPSVVARRGWCPAVGRRGQCHCIHKLLNDWQARAAQGFDVACFAMDWEARRATCPHGHQSSKWSQTHDGHGNEIIDIRFARSDCLGCPSRGLCTTRREGPREITVRPQAQHMALQAARQRQRTAVFKASMTDGPG